MPTSATVDYAFEPLADGVVAGIARRDGFGTCNTGLIDLGGNALAFDTGSTGRAAEELRSESARRFGRPPAFAANSHWHFDHSLGNRRFQGLPIFGTRRTREILLELHDELMVELTRANLEKGVRELEGRRGPNLSADALEDVEFMLQYQRALLSEVEEVVLTPPDRTFETRLALPGTRGAELLSFGRGHTEADAVLFLRREKLLFAGDLAVHGLQPSLGSGDPPHWLVVLDDLERLGAERVVPGHGAVMTADGIDETRRYLSAIVKAAEASAGAPLPPELRRWEGSPTLEENLTAARKVLAARARSADGPVRR
ncbi:MAG: MBL fold metallo-hydrolase [Thermoplasmata archaeon]|nr:MBL fold metallo-hydrolase [Thermoplasmata archaeon]